MSMYCHTFNVCTGAVFISVLSCDELDCCIASSAAENSPRGGEGQ